MAELRELAWPAARLGELVAELGGRSGLATHSPELPAPPPGLESEPLGEWIERAAGYCGLEAEPVETRYARAESLVRRAGPALIRLPDGGPDADHEPLHFLALLGPRRGGRVAVLGADHAVVRIPAAALAAALRRGPEALAGASIDRLLDRVGVTPRRRARARRALLERSLGAFPIAGAWLLRRPAGAAFSHQLRDLGLGRRVAVLVLAHALQFGLWIASWYLIGRGALAGSFDPGRLAAWTLLLATLIPVHLFSHWWQGRIVVDFGILLKRRLLAGALRLPLDEIRRRGSGELLGRVIESEVFQALMLSGGFLAVAAAVEVMMVLPVLRIGAGGLLHAAAFVLSTALVMVLAWRYYGALSRWTSGRLALTLELVERMVGYRTRLAQQLRRRWHDGEDHALASYLGLARPMDTAGALLIAGVPRGWLVIGTLAIGPAFIAGAPGIGSLAVALGGNLLAFAAMGKLAAGLVSLATAHVAWRQIAPLFTAAGRGPELGEPATALAAAAPVPAAPETQPSAALLAADNLSFRYRAEQPRVLRSAALRLRRGERVLLEGPSGSGKSTLVALLCGLRRSDAGLILLDGLDRRTLGDESWRSRLASAPQFQENHVLIGTLAFNLLMGRRWPPTRDDLREAEDLCREIGLGELLERMPNGLQQLVGETGWQLSHGERSRLYLARALLQRSEIVILDETFAALDPGSLRQALAATLERAPTLLVVAHP